MVATSLDVLRRGSDDPLPERRLVHAGPLSAVLENGALRSIRIGTQEVVRGIYAAVRDRNWGTIAPRFLTYTVEERGNSFQLSFTAEHINNEVDFLWQGIISGTSDGTITCILDGVARRTFLKNRLGFCILHPMELAGTPVEIETTQGSVQSVFPQHIAPHQPFKDILAMHYSLPEMPEARMRLHFEGEIFETEDQRNWTDASYKTYCTPLHLPYPVELQAGEHIVQKVILNLEGVSPPEMRQNEQADVQHVTVFPQTMGRLPEIGLSSAPDQERLTRQELERLRRLHLGYLWAELDLNRDTWQQALQQATEEAGILGIALELSVISGDKGEGLESLVESIKANTLPVARMLLFPGSTFATTEPVLSRARTLLQNAGLSIEAGGGSRANYAEFNRTTLPLELMDIAGCAINPQVHTFDNVSLVETLRAQGEVVKNIQALVGSMPQSIGPVTLKPRFNAAATGPVKEPEPGILPDNVDARQVSLFCAGWTVGSIRHLAAAGAAWITYYETVGWRGVMEHSQPTHAGTTFPSLPGALFPLYHIFADLGEFKGAELLTLEVSNDTVVESLALRKGKHVMLLIANLKAEAQAVQIRMPPLHNAQIRMLDETNVEQALFNGEAFRASRMLATTRTAFVELGLLPYAIARIDGLLEEA